MTTKLQSKQEELIPRTSIADLAYNALYQKIVGGEWAVGDKIPNETELCAELGVSRVSVRSAIQKMTALGMLEIRRGDGTYVKLFSLQDYLQQAVPFIIQSNDHREMNQFREALESAAVKLVIERHNEAEIAQLEQLFYQSNSAFLQQDVASYVEHDLLFHRQLCVMSHNKILLIMWDAFARPLAETIRTNVEAVYRSQSSVEDHHLMIVHAIRARDEAAALHHLHIILNGILP